MLTTLLFAALSFAQPKEGSLPDQQKAIEWNQANDLHQTRTAWPVLGPFSEVEKTGYAAISGNNTFELGDLRLAMAKNLPADVQMVVYISSADKAPALRSELGRYLGKRLKFLLVPSGGNETWGRDSLPFPVRLQKGSVSLGLVDSIYPQDFEPDEAVAQAFSAPKVKTNLYFRGGNLLFDLTGNCFAEMASEVKAMKDPATFFKTYFGCQTVTILDRRGGIGDIDERLKFLPDGSVATDEDSYARILEARGYRVHKIPRTGDNYETYMNTLYVNGTIFVPQMGISEDEAALNAYRNLGFNAVGVNTKMLADWGHGNIHCVTMNYPEGTFISSGEDFVKFASATQL